jgi:uncharacterized membrane protein YjjP (DUF1212 family)
MDTPDRGIGTARSLRLVVRVAAGLLACGAQTQDVEDAIASMARGLGLPGVQAAVTFSTISVTVTPSGDAAPTTFVRLVRERGPEYSRLADLADLSRAIGAGQVDVPTAESTLERVADDAPTYGRLVSFAAPGVSAAGATIMFGGTFVDALATLLIAFLVQPALAGLDRSGLPPFFRLAFGSAATTALVASAVGLGAPISGGLVLTGSLLRFLPGYALVSGFRDLVDQSIVSGTARLAEALLLGAAVAGGTALAIGLAAELGVRLSIETSGATEWTLAYTAAAALIAVGAFAVRLDVPTWALAQTAVLGAVGWLAYNALTPPSGAVDPGLMTLATSIYLGLFGRLAARRMGAPSALWVVPAILPLLPGLQIVTAMLATSDLLRVIGLLDAAVTAFLIGVGVASGDIIVVAIRGVRDRVVVPAVGLVSDGVDIVVSSAGAIRSGPEVAAEDQPGDPRRPT